MCLHQPGWGLGDENVENGKEQTQSCILAQQPGSPVVLGCQSLTLSPPSLSSPSVSRACLGPEQVHALEIPSWSGPSPSHRGQTISLSARTLPVDGSQGFLTKVWSGNLVMSSGMAQGYLLWGVDGLSLLSCKAHSGPSWEGKESLGLRD